MNHQESLSADFSNITSYDAASKFFKSNFEKAATEGLLQDYRNLCKSSLEKNPNKFIIPHAFAYAARSLLHDPSMWIQDSDKVWLPSPQLMDDLEADLSSERAINCRDNYFYPILWGIKDYIQGNVDYAFRQFSTAAQKEDFFKIIKCDLGGGASFAKKYPSVDITTQKNLFFNRKLNVYQSSLSLSELVISISFDEIYFLAFGKQWLFNISKINNKKVAIHFHLIFKNGCNFELISELASSCKDLRVDFLISFDEHINYDRAYYACARFIYASDLLKISGRPTLLADADAFIPDIELFENQHLNKILHESKLLGLITSGPWNGYLPWRKFSAGWLLAPNREESINFFDIVANAIEYFWDERKPRNWWIDQIALEVAHRYCSDRIGDGAFNDIHLVLPNLLETSESYKIQSISNLPTMKALLNTGKSYWEALASLQRHN